MKKVLSQYRSITTLHDKESYLMTLHTKKKKAVKKAGDALGFINAKLHGNRKKVISIIKNKLLSLIPKHEEEALVLFQKKINLRDLWGENILEILLYETIPDPTKESYIPSSTRMTERDGIMYDFYLSESWFYKFEERQIIIRDLYLVLENVHSKYWEEYVEIQMLHETVPTDTLFLSIKIL
jgi:hypothetical protein